MYTRCYATESNLLWNYGQKHGKINAQILDIRETGCIKPVVLLNIAIEYPIA